MNLKINIWKIIGVVLLLLLAFFFFKIVIYVIISSILFLIGSPITQQIERIKIGSKKIPDAIAALITLVFIVSVIMLLFKMIVPPLIKQVDLLTELNFYDVVHNILIQFPAVNDSLKSFGNENDLKMAISAQLSGFLNFSNFSLILDNLVSYTGTIIGGTLCVLFITFFFLKDEQILKDSIMTITPSNSENAISEVLKTSKKMLSKYFAGLFIDMLIVGTLSGFLMFILGIDNALIIGFTAGLLNGVPYIGSMITMLVAVFLGTSGCIAHEEYAIIGSVITKIFFGLLSINLIDGFVIQPFIFSSSVKAHPLEIFIVTLMGAIAGGIGGMIVALPAYTILRIIAKQFLTQFKFFKKITENISE
ncbi:MAG: AI-2E family transporter [Sphingobacteriaceae bacterium]